MQKEFGTLILQIITVEICLFKAVNCQNNYAIICVELF